MIYEKCTGMAGNNVYAPIGARLSTERSFLGDLPMNKDMYHHYNMIRGEDRMNPPQMFYNFDKHPTLVRAIVSSNPG